MRPQNEINNRQLILVELNEINFDVVRRYLAIDSERFPSLRRCISGSFRETTSEVLYENLEPWIQWPSIHTGKTYDEHKVFRLGDIINSDASQIFEVVENAGYSVGVLSAMNAANNLKKPKYFIPDPWSNVDSDGSFWSRLIGSAVAQAVNDNAKRKITVASAFSLILALARFAQVKHYSEYLRLLFRSKRATWNKALFLDLFLHDFHMSLLKNNRPSFSTIFFNAGAHIQHHYFFNSPCNSDKNSIRNPSWYISEKEDPVADMLTIYDKIIGEILAIGNDVIIATGLSQKPYEHVKFYYRPRDHRHFLDQLGVKYKTVLPRMTRDFLVEFDTHHDASVAEQLLKSIKVIGDDKQVFEEIDNRGDSLFVTLTYPDEITKETRVFVEGKEIHLLPAVAFVALKNGMHQGKGFAYYSSGVENFAPPNGAHVKEIYGAISKYFDLTA
jgi:hypothetical protein